MKPIVEDHPGYPFQPSFLQAHAARSLVFVDGPDPATPEHALLGEFLGLTHAFAFLEKIVQGEVRCDLPAHVDRVLAAFISPEDEGERLAAGEQGILDWTPESADSLVDALDEIGVKIMCLDDPEDGSRRDGPRLGAFAFEADTGPSFLVGASAHTPEAAFMAAHAFGHLVADVDPYRPRLCRWDAHSFVNLSDRMEEARADRFARALLMPREPFLGALRELVEPVGADLTGDASDDTDLRPAQLAALFGVPVPIVLLRLVDLGMPVLEGDVDPAGSEGPVASEARSASAGSSDGVESPESPGSPESPDDVPTRLLTPGERYVNLALAAYAGCVLQPPDLARFLGVSEPAALRMAEIAGVAPVRETAFD